MNRKRARDDDDDAPRGPKRQQADRAARQNTKSRVVSAARVEEERIAHLMNLERDNYLRVDDDKRPQARAEEANDDSGDEDEGRPKKRGRSSSTLNRKIIPLRGTKATRQNATSFAQILEIEDYKSYPPHIPTYSSAAVGLSSKAGVKLSKMSGYIAPYTDPETGTRYANMMEFASMKEKAQ